MRLEKEDLKRELKFIFFRSLFLNIAVYLISVIFIGFTLPVAAGLIVGTIGMLFNLFLINKSVFNIVKSGGNKNASKMFIWYIIRMSIASVIIAAAMLWCVSCMIGAVIPYFYPKLVYGGKTLFRKEEKSE